MDEFTVTIRPDLTSASSNHSGVWGPFTLIEKVGEGSFGEVYRAFDTTLEREVALKLLRAAGPDRELDEKAVLREARAMARVRHPNVVPVYGVDRHQGRVGFWSDFVNGKTLSAIVHKDGPFGAREAALIGMDLCKAVGAVHAAGLLHGDIKTGNVMRESGGRILLMDFGLTREHGAGLHYSGTPAYMAPELLAGVPPSVSTDIYALGVLLFRLLTGKYPVDEKSIQTMKAAHESGARQAVLDIRPDLPHELARVVETASHTDAAKRYKTAGQLAAGLAEAIGLGAAPDVSQPAKPGGSRRRIWEAVAAVAALMAPFAIPQVRSALFPGVAHSAAGPVVNDDYQKARDLLDHYYRPHALDTAIPLLEKTVANDPNFAPAYADLGRANLLQFTQLRDTKYIEPARQASLRALSLKPDLASAHVTLGILYTWTEKNDLASQELDDALKIDKFNASAYAARGNLLLNQGRTAEVEPLLLKAVSLAPDDWGTLGQLGGYYDELGKYALAAEQYQRAADLAPDNARAQNNLGFVYRLQGRFPEAEAAYRKAISLEPTAGHYRNLGLVLSEGGKYPEASRMLERAIALKPEDYRAWGFLAATEANSGVAPLKVDQTYREAISRAEILRKQTPNGYLLADLALYYAALGDAHRSEPLIKQAVARAPDRGEVLYEVATAYELLHKRDQSLFWIHKAVAAGMSPQFLSRIPQLAGLRADPRYRTSIQL